MQERQWITPRRGEPDALAEELAKQLQEVQAERDRAGPQRHRRHRNTPRVRGEDFNPATNQMHDVGSPPRPRG